MFKEEMAEEFSKTERQKFLLLRTITNPKRDKKNIYNIHVVCDVLQFHKKKKILQVARVKEITYQGMTIILTTNFPSTLPILKMDNQEGPTEEQTELGPILCINLKLICRVHHEKCWAGRNTSWNQDCQEKYQ